jgi:thymidylate synthase (FAD)
MHVVQPSARIVNFMGLPPEHRGWLEAQQFDRVRPYGVEAVRFIEETGRKCYRSEGARTPESYAAFIRSHVLGSRHTQMLRFSLVVVDFMVDRGIAQEINRHAATMTPQHESQRYCNYSKGRFGNSVGFIRPTGLTAEQEAWWTRTMEQAEQAYFEGLRLGLKAQIAADALPRATASLLTLCGNFQAWRHFLLVRTTKACHPKLLNLTVEDHLREEETGATIDPAVLAAGEAAAAIQPSLLKQFQMVFPLLFDDIEPLGDHVTNMQKTR